MRQACVQSEYISSIDKPIQQHQPFYIQALTNETSTRYKYFTSTYGMGMKPLPIFGEKGHC